MALKFIQQDATTLREAYLERKAEYDALRAAGRWSGAVLHGGTLLELALKLVMCKHLGITNLPTIFQVHDLDLLLCCSGQLSRFKPGTTLETNFSLVQNNWSTALRYEGAIKTQQNSDQFNQALFDSANGVITYLSQYF
jgi:hypothetical protein